MLYEKTGIQSKQSRLKAFKVHKKGDLEVRTVQSNAVHWLGCPTNNDHTLIWNASDVGQIFRMSDNIRCID